MICKPCAKAADMLAEAIGRGSVGALGIYNAESLHGRCKGCDCQHQVDRQVAGKGVRT